MPGSVENTGSVKRTAYVASHSVAYLGFEKLEQALAFNDAFNGHKFVDTAKTTSGSLQSGSEYFASVERAMSQNVPPLQRRNPHPVTGTIEADSDYQAFLKNLESELEAPISLRQPSSLSPSSPEGKRPRKDVVTPLMEEIRTKRKERDEKKKTKSVPRSARKGNQPIEQNTADPVGKTISRKKKRRGSEAANSSKRDDTHATERKNSGKADRNIAITPRRDDENRSTNSHASASNKSPSSFTNAGATVPNGSKTPSRSSNRPRYGRGSRGKGKFSPNQHGPPGNGGSRAAHHSQDSLHSSVRVLKKEASATSAT